MRHRKFGFYQTTLVHDDKSEQPETSSGCNFSSSVWSFWSSQFCLLLLHMSHNPKGNKDVLMLQFLFKIYIIAQLQNNSSNNLRTLTWNSHVCTLTWHSEFYCFGCFLNSEPFLFLNFNAAWRNRAQLRMTQMLCWTELLRNCWETWEGKRYRFHLFITESRSFSLTNCKATEFAFQENSDNAVSSLVHLRFCLGWIQEANWHKCRWGHQRSIRADSDYVSAEKDKRVSHKHLSKKTA